MSNEFDNEGGRMVMKFEDGTGLIQVIQTLKDNDRLYRTENVNEHTIVKLIGHVNELFEKEAVIIPHAVIPVSGNVMTHHFFDVIHAFKLSSKFDFDDPMPESKNETKSNSKA